MARNKQSGGGQGPHGGVKTKQNYPQNRQQNTTNNSNDYGNNLHCNNHGWNASHDTAHCKQLSNQINNKNDQKDDKKRTDKPSITCNTCGRTGHLAADCRTKNYQQRNYNQNDPPPAYTRRDTARDGSYQRPNKEWEYEAEVPLKRTSPAVVEAVEDYCKHCNERGHNPTNCDNVMGMYAALRSKLYCSGCRFRGHLLDDCRNPISKECSKCGQKGHRFNECSSNPNTVKLQDFFRQEAAKDKRFTWDIVPTLHESQQAEKDYRIAMENAKLNGIPLTEEEHAHYTQRIMHTRDIFDTNIVIKTAKKMVGVDVNYNNKNIPAFPNRPPFRADFTPTPRPYPNQPPPHPNVTTRSSTSATLTLDPAARQSALERFRHAGFNTANVQLFEKFYDAQITAHRSSLEKAIAAKIKHSLTSYTLVKANPWLLRHEALILTKTKIPQDTWDKVKFSISQGSGLYRDNRAMQMLFERRVPQCTECRRAGYIFDRWFNPIPVAASKQQILALEDWSDWGIFVGLQCRCSSSTDKFEYVNCSITDLEGLSEEEEER